jgi:hypothetical protein
MTFLVERSAGKPAFALRLLSTGNRRSVRAFCVEIAVYTTGEPALRIRLGRTSNRRLYRVSTLLVKVVVDPAGKAAWKIWTFSGGFPFFNERRNSVTDFGNLSRRGEASPWYDRFSNISPDDHVSVRVSDGSTKDGSGVENQGGEEKGGCWGNHRRTNEE